MAKITVSNLNIAGSKLFQYSESFLMDLKDEDLYITGGILTPFTNIIVISVVKIPASEDIFAPSISVI